MTQTSSTPAFDEFNPDHIPYQRQVIRLIRKEFDFSLGTLEILLSGAVGSAKSTLAAHVGLLHVLTYPGSRLLLARRAMPDLKDTIFQKFLEHMEGTEGLKENGNYWVNQTRASIQFSNGSQILSRSWSDKKYKKMRSLELSACVFEELTENEGDDVQVYNEIKMRVGRLPHVPENFILCCTNPDSPASYWYNYYFANHVPTRRVFYSRTRDNIFLPLSYVEQLEKDFDPKMARRMLEGEWIEITKEVVYYAYSTENRSEKEYEINRRLPVWVSFDWNIGQGKPLSCVLFQYDPEKDFFHVFDEVVVHGMRTAESCDELAHRGLLDYNVRYILSGDATGRARDTRSNMSDYDILKKFFANYETKKKRPIRWELQVGRSNPPIRKRHNLVNGYCKNAKGQIRLMVYKKAEMTDKGLRLTQLKKGGNYIEDDSKEWQHITTALGYGMVNAVKARTVKPQGTVRL